MRDFLNGTYTLTELTPRERLEALYEFLHRLPDKTTRKNIYTTLPTMTHYQIDRALTLLDFANILDVWLGTVTKTKLAKEIERRGTLTLKDFSQAPKWVIKSLTRKAIRREVYIGDDTSTGYSIYYNYSQKQYVLEDVNRRKIKFFNDLGLILTYSLETSGNERLVCEMASWTWVRKLHPNNFPNIIDTLAKFIKNVLKIYFGFTIEESAIKGGLEYMSEAGSYISEEGSGEFVIDKIMWDDAKCVIEYIHERKYAVKTPKGVSIRYKPIRKGKIEITLKEFEKKHPEAMQQVRTIQSTLKSFKVRPKR